MNKEIFIREITKIGINYTEKMLDQLEVYCDFLLEYNTHTNLTAIRNKEEVYLKHFYDSLTITKAIDLNKINNCLDIGTGAGFPGLVLKIFFPHLKVVLLDSNNKKTKFLEQLVNKLEVTNIEIINNRVEKYSLDNLNSFDLVMARAVTNLPVLAELAFPLVKKDGIFIAMKGNMFEELANGQYAITHLGGEIINIISFDLIIENSKRSLVVAKKNRITKPEEIRSYEKIIKKPLQIDGK